MSTMYVWEDAEVMGGSAFEGTICVLADSVEEAREIARIEYRIFNPRMDEVGWGNSAEEHAAGKRGGYTYAQMLERTLAKTPTEKRAVFAHGGDL
jgi:hypothetical protein